MKKKKKGFTLVEIIVTIALLGLIGSIIAVNVVGLSKKQEDKEIERVRSTLQAAAEGYAENKGIEEGCVKDTVLIEGGWLKGNTLPQDKHYSVKIKKDGAEKKYTVHEGENCQGEQIRETQKKYTITYIEEGEQTKTETVISGQDYEVKAPNNNSNFDGWLDTQTGETYDKEYTIKNVKSNKTLVAKRTQGQYLIKYYDGKTLKKVETVSQGKTYKIAEKIKKDKYEFKGWKEKNASKIYQPGNIVNNVQKDITLEAQWGAKVKINVVNGIVNTTTNGNNGEYTLEPNATGTFTLTANEGYILDDYTCSPQAETVETNADRTSLKLTIKKPTSCTVKFKKKAVNLTLKVPAYFGYSMTDLRNLDPTIDESKIKLSKDGALFLINLEIPQEKIGNQAIKVYGDKFKYTLYSSSYLVNMFNVSKDKNDENILTGDVDSDNLTCKIKSPDDSASTINLDLQNEAMGEEITCDLSDFYIGFYNYLSGRPEIQDYKNPKSSDTFVVGTYSYDYDSGTDTMMNEYDVMFRKLYKSIVADRGAGYCDGEIQFNDIGSFTHTDTNDVIRKYSSISPTMGSKAFVDFCIKDAPPASGIKTARFTNLQAYFGNIDINDEIVYPTYADAVSDIKYYSVGSIFTGESVKLERGSYNYYVRLTIKQYKDSYNYLFKNVKTTGDASVSKPVLDGSYITMTGLMGVNNSSVSFEMYAGGASFISATGYNCSGIVCSKINNSADWRCTVKIKGDDVNCTLSGGSEDEGDCPTGKKMVCGKPNYEDEDFNQTDCWCE